MKKHLDSALHAFILAGIAITVIATGVHIFFLVETGKATLLTVLQSLATPFLLTLIFGFSLINRKQNKYLREQIDKNSELRQDLWAQTALSEGLEAKDKAMQGLLSALTSYIVQNTPDEQETIEIINPATGEKATITIKPIERQPE